MLFRNKKSTAAITLAALLIASLGGMQAFADDDEHEGRERGEYGEGHEGREGGEGGEGGEGPGLGDSGPASSLTGELHLYRAALEGAFTTALKSAKPGTPAFREAVRDALEKTSKLVGANGTYTMSPTNHGGYAPTSPVLIEVANGSWKLVK